MGWGRRSTDGVQAAYLISTFVDAESFGVNTPVQAAYLISTFVDGGLNELALSGLGSLFNFYFCRCWESVGALPVQAAYLISTFVDSIFADSPGPRLGSLFNFYFCRQGCDAFDHHGVQAAYLISTFVDAETFFTSFIVQAAYLISTFVDMTLLSVG